LKLKPEVKQLWLEGLRSGDFPQCSGKLSNGVGYCCLGVLSELAHREGVIAREEQQNTWKPVSGGGTRTETSVHYGAYAASNYLPREVADWAFEEYDPNVVYWENPRVKDPRPEGHLMKVEVTSLAELNDEGFTFEEIADVVEEQL
jgi:hypothetical protein